MLVSIALNNRVYVPRAKRIWLRKGLQNPTEEFAAFSCLHPTTDSISQLELWEGFLSQIALNLDDPVHVDCVCPLMGWHVSNCIIALFIRKKNNNKESWAPHHIPCLYEEWGLASYGEFEILHASLTVSCYHLLSDILVYQENIMNF